MTNICKCSSFYFYISMFNKKKTKGSNIHVYQIIKKIPAFYYFDEASSKSSNNKSSVRDSPFLRNKIFVKQNEIVCLSKLIIIKKSHHFYIA